MPCGMYISRVTMVRGHAAKPDGKPVQYVGKASVTFNDALKVRSVRIMHTPRGLVVNMPTDKHEKHQDVTYSIDSDLTKDIADAVLNAYRKHISADQGDKVTTIRLYQTA